MPKLVTVKEAAIHYLNGAKVRRYITDEMFAQARELAHSEGRPFNDNHSWKDTWLWLDEHGKRWSNKPEQMGTDKEWKDSAYYFEEKEGMARCFSPLEVIEKFGFNSDRLWEIKE